MAAPGGDATLDRAVGKAARRLMPFLILMYMVSFLDRTNVGLAKNALAADVGVSASMYAFGAGIFFVGYAIFELPSNLVLHRVGARLWMARIMVTWGLVSAATMFVSGPKSFAAIRLLLGIAEAGFFPGIIFYLTYWFPEAPRARLMGLFYFGYPLALTFGNPLSGALLGLEGAFGLRGWQWMFLVEGLAAVVVGVLTLVVLDDRPEQAGWLDDGEKRALAETLEREAEAKEGSAGDRMGAVLRRPANLVRLVEFTGLYFTIQIASYGVVFYLPSQVAALLGRKIGFEVGLVSALPWLCALALTATLPPLARRLGRPRLFILLCLVLVAGGLAVSAHSGAVVAIAALCAAGAGVVAVQAIFWTLPTGYFTGVAAAGSVAIVNSVGNLGGFAAPNLRAAGGSFALAAAGLIGIAIALTLPARGFAAKAVD